jgi:hypothetical protein
MRTSSYTTERTKVSRQREPEQDGLCTAHSRPAPLLAGTESAGCARTHGVQSPYVRDSSTPDLQRQAEACLQALPRRPHESLTRSNDAVDDDNLANDLPDWWPYPVQCGHGHPWSPGHVLVSYVRCPCRADEGISGHTVVRCTADGCRSAWYRPAALPARRSALPRHWCSRPADLVRRPDAKWRTQYRGEPGGEPS